MDMLKCSKAISGRVQVRDGNFCKQLIYEHRSAVLIIVIIIKSEFTFLAMFPPTVGHQVVLPFPAKEKTFAYTDKDIPILGRFVGSSQKVLLIIITCARFNGDEDVVLKMPPGRKVSDLK